MKHPLAHAEALANAITGIALAQIVLVCFGVELKRAIALNAVMLAVSYARSFVLRRLFGRLATARIVRGHSATLVGAP